MAAIILDKNEKELYSMCNKIDALREDLELFHKLTDELADFIMEEIPGEPSKSEGAIECAIRLLKKANDKGIFDTGIGDKLFKPTNVHTVKPVIGALFHGINCLRNMNDGSIGFFKSVADIRPSSCTWIDKETAEKLYGLFSVENS